jgi:heterodisulfide reductase subunit B
MKYFYYPGCSLQASAAEYDTSTRAVMRELKAELIEIEDWTCCGASAGDSGGFLLSLALPARNLALAEKTGVFADFLAPCSACYLNLKKVDVYADREEGLIDRINTVLAEEGLVYSVGRKVRHLLDVLANDFGSERLAANVKVKLAGLRVVPYYGCQALRPFSGFDDPEFPHSMKPLIEALGAEVHSWSMGAKCCGAGLITTKKNVAMELTGALLKAAEGADCIVTVCPMCQMNLEANQKKLSAMYGTQRISVLYLPQLIGLALGISEEDLGLKLNLVIESELREKVRAARDALAAA